MNSKEVDSDVETESGSQHGNIPRISVDSLEDWQRIKDSYAAAAMESLDRRVASTPRSTKDIERLRENLKQVSWGYLTRCVVSLIARVIHTVHRQDIRDVQTKSAHKWEEL